MVNYFRFRNFNKRVKIDKKSFDVFVLQHLLYNKKVNDYVRIKIMLKLQKLRHNAYKTHINQRCLKSLKNRTINIVSVSKAFFKIFLNKGVLTGFKKSSW